MFSVQRSAPGLLPLQAIGPDARPLTEVGGLLRTSEPQHSIHGFAYVRKNDANFTVSRVFLRWGPGEMILVQRLRVDIMRFLAPSEMSAPSASVEVHLVC